MQESGLINGRIWDLNPEPEEPYVEDETEGVNELEEALKWINEADTIEKVAQIWHDYSSLKQNKLFIDATLRRLRLCQTKNKLK